MLLDNRISLFSGNGEIVRDKESYIPPFNILNKFPCCAPFKIISPLFNKAGTLSPVNDVPGTIPPVAKCGILDIAAIIAATPASPSAIPTNGIPE